MFENRSTACHVSKHCLPEHSTLCNLLLKPNAATIQGDDSSEEYKSRHRCEIEPEVGLDNSVSRSAPPGTSESPSQHQVEDLNNHVGELYNPASTRGDSLATLRSGPAQSTMQASVQLSPYAPLPSGLPSSAS